MARSGVRTDVVELEGVLEQGDIASGLVLTCWEGGQCSETGGEFYYLTGFGYRDVCYPSPLLTNFKCCQINVCNSFKGSCMPTHCRKARLRLWYKIWE